MTTYFSVFGNALQTPVYNNLTPITFGTNIQLAWSTQFQNTNLVVSTIMHMNPTVGGLTVTMPDATQTSNGQQFLLNNVSGNSFNLNNFSGGLISAIAGPSASVFYLLDNSTQAGTWIQIPSGGGFSAVTSVNAAPIGATTIANLTITGGPITTSGTLDFTFPTTGDLGQLINFGTLTGIAVRTAGSPPGPISWALRTLTGVPDQISITNGDGVAANPTIGLAANIKNVTSIQVGNLSIFGNTIAALAGSNIILAPQVGGATQTSNPISLLGTGLASTPIKFWNAANTFNLSLQGGALTVNVPLTLPATPPTDGQALVHVSAGQMGWETIAGLPSSSVPNAIPKFLNTGGELVDTNILVTGASNADMTNVNSIVIQNLRLCVSGATTISTTSNYLGLEPINGITTLISPVGSASIIQFYNANNVNFTGLSGPAAAAGITFALPDVDGAAKALMTTDGTANWVFSNLTTDYLSKGFAVFNGTTAGASAPLASAGLAAGTPINRTGTGAYTITVLTPGFSTTNYGISGTVNGVGYIGSFVAIGSTSFSFITYDNAGTPTDFSVVTFQMFGLQ